MKKRTISKILIVAMLLSILPKTNFAQEEKSNISSISEKENSKAENVEKKEEVTKESKELNAEQKEDKKEKENSAKDASKEEKVKEKESEPKTEATTKVRKRRDANNYQATVTFVGQWTGESRRKENSTKDFTNGDEKLGKPLDNPGLFRGVAKTFLGWSDKSPVGNGKLAEGARLFSTEDKISTAFPNGIPADAKLYGVYFSLNDPETPLPEGTFGLGFALLGGIDKIKINSNELTIDKSEKEEDILPNTKLFSQKSEGTTRTILDFYNKKDDLNNINEVITNSEFKMDDVTAMLAYKNPNVGYVGPVLSSTYKDNEFKTNDGKTGYTYVDLVVNLDKDLIVPDKLYLEFKGYSWRPLYVMGENNTVLNIFNPQTNQNLGNTKDSFKSLVNNSSPKVTFGVETNNNKNITIRMILRTDNERIPESSITPDKGGTIAEKILENMTLKALSKSDLKALFPTKSEEELNKNVLRISDEKAKELSKTDGETTLKITGYIKGNSMAYAGKLSWLTLSSENEIKKVPSNTIALGYTTEKYNVIYSFISGTTGKDLPIEIIEKQPQDKFNVENGTKETLPKYDDVKVEGGTWKFRNWYVEKEDETAIVENEATVENSDLVLVGEWVFEEDKKPEPQKLEPQKPEVKPNGKNTGKLAKTSISGGLSYTLASILALGVAVAIGYKKKDNE